jgi:diphthamide biosynthesis protein 2
MRCIAFFNDAAGYLHIIEQMKELIKAAGKRSYTLVMGRPNSAKLANFPQVCHFNSELFSVSLSISSDDFYFSFWQCEIFVYVSCAQTAQLDSKDFLAPVITPFEAVFAFSRYATL